ncbi:hypothetical protein HYN69_15205 [Gemmobacter aquarius]|uniref:Uncharacterized protein n=1 Tax=Paragemmobacter aquarius TaxID=2169400 RepID=A0A2S0UPB9_9RHOB|nr:hypothetical protein [Gemmobacter aquarius]AWB49668.1 hypothetical protein HYN69_15205 [Gemmobacter aquarius]
MSEPDQITEAIKRALDAAEAANFAAEDIARISAAHRAFAEGVARSQKRSTALAGGAALGALLGLGLGGLIWFRSVADLREAGTVQATAAELLVEQVTRFDAMLDKAEEREAVVEAALTAMTEKVSHDLAKLGREQKPMDAQVATAIRDGVKEDLGAAKDEVLAAIAAAPAGGTMLDSPEMKVLLEELHAMVREAVAAPATNAAAATSEPAKAPAPKPKPKPATRAAKPAEPDPFVYP